MAVPITKTRLVITKSAPKITATSGDNAVIVTPTAVHQATATLEPASTDVPLHEEMASAAASETPAEERTGYEIENDIPAGDSPVLIRRKVFPAAAMTLDDAVDNMELVGHDFYLFIDKATGAPSVVYHRRGWTYGVITLDADCNAEEAKAREELLAYRSQESANA